VLSAVKYRGLIEGSDYAEKKGFGEVPVIRGEEA
jgi:hypothetical protein